jgi:hypothetical protein
MTLADEAQRYLAVVELFRAEGYEPHWRRETWIERAQLNSAFMPKNKRRKSCHNSDR